MTVVHEGEGSTVVGKTIEPWWWELNGEGLLIDFGRVYHDDPEDYWYWHLIQYNNTYYVGLPGVRNFHAITQAQAHDHNLLDEEIEECLDSYGA